MKMLFWHAVQAQPHLNHDLGEEEGRATIRAHGVTAEDVVEDSGRTRC